MKGSDLVAVPYENGSFCRRKAGNKLIVLVKNQGDDPADSDTHTKVEWGLGGVYGFKEEPTATSGLSKGDKPIELIFTCPDNCFAPDCEFYITVDSKNELTNEKKGIVGVDDDAYDNTWNNIKKGVCYERDKPFLPDLVPVQYEDTKTYYKRDGNKLKVKIKNIGSAIAEPSKTEVKFQDGTKKTKNMPEMVPGQVEEVEVDIPSSHHSGNFRFKITADVEDAVEEKNEDNNEQEDRFIEEEQPL